MAGWSISTSIPNSATTIHHPSGDVKKISAVKSGGTRITMTSWSESPLNYHWKINSWSYGVTEPGSSGSPLFNEHGLIIGQLHGGDSSCSNPKGYDSFGALFASANPKASRSESLFTWINPTLDPSIRMMQGAYLNYLRSISGKRRSRCAIAPQPKAISSLLDRDVTSQ